MKTVLDRLHAKVGDLWWYSLMIFVACRSGDVIQAFIGLWLVPKYVGLDELGAVLPLQQLSGFFATPLVVIATVFAKFVNTYATRGEFGKVRSFIRDVLLAACAVFVVCIVGACLLIPHFYIRLNIASGMLTVLVLAAGFAGNVSSLFSSALQGLKMFRTMTVQNLISAPIRLVTLLVAMPFRALSGYILGQATPPATCSVLAALSLRSRLKSVPLDTSWRKDLPEIWRYLWPVAIYTGFATLFGTLTMTLYRQRLPEVESAAYYLLSRFAETGAYVGSSLMVVIAPLVSEAHEQGKSPIRLLRQSLVCIGIGAVAFAVFFGIVSGPLLSFSDSWRPYADYAYLLPVLSVNFSLSAAISVCCSYEMACRRFKGLAVVTALNMLWVTFLICFMGYEFFRGVLPDALVDGMASLHIASLKTLTLLGVPFGILQLAFILFVIRRHTQPSDVPERGHEPVVADSSLTAESFNCAPVLLIGFNRPDFLRDQIKAVRLVRPRKLYVAVDGPRPDRAGEAEKCRAVRDCVKYVDWPCEVSTLFRDENLGCGRAVSGAISWFFENEESGIVLEDDCRPSPAFFRFASEMLDRYRDDERIGAVNGFNYFNLQSDTKASYHFSSHMDVWGWASWRRAWRKYEFDLKSHADRLDAIIDATDMTPYMKRVKKAGAREALSQGGTWDFQFSVVSMANRWLNVVPRERLVINVGQHDAAGTHTCGYYYFARQMARCGRMVFPLVEPEQVACDCSADRLREKMEGAIFPRGLTWLGAKLPILSPVLTAVGTVVERIAPVLFRL